MAKQSIFAAKKEAEQPVPSTGLALPSGNSMATVKPPEQDSYSNYIAFMHRDKGKWGDVKAKIPDLSDGDAVLFQGGEPSRVSNFTFFLLDAHQYFCTLDGEFKPKRAWMSKPADAGKEVKEFLATMVLLLQDGKLIPATFRVQGAMCKGVYDALKTATQDAEAWAAWLQQSPDHKAAASLQPNLRFKTHLSWRPKKGHSGFIYFISSANIVPTSIGDAAMFTAAKEDADTMEKVELAVQAFADHKKHIETLAK